MDPSRANPREYLRQAIDTEIESLEGSIRALRHRRNALAPVSSLPTEVISTIFSLVRAASASLPFILGEKPDRLAWLRVAHVCHQWREIALNHSLFWSHIDFTTVSSAGAAEILTRAKKVPLHLKADVLSGRWDDARFSVFRKQLQDHISHIRHLDLGAEPIDFNWTLHGLTSPAPTLEYLLLTHRQSLDRTLDSYGFIPDTLFDGSAPRLARLELCNCAISWKSPLLRCLEHLDISSTFERPSLSVWLDALDEMPQLQTLTLDSAIPIAHSNTSLSSKVERAVTLSSLTLLDITSDARDCGLALAHLVLPALTSLCLRAESRCPDGSDVPEILPYVARYVNTQPLQSVFIRKNVACVEILAWTMPDFDIYAESFGVEVEVVLYNSTTNPRTTHTEIFDTMMAAFPLDSLVTFAAQKHSRLNEQFWLHHAPQWPLLQHARLAPPAAHGFREMLLQDDNGRCERPLFPLLKKLTLFDTALSARRTLDLCDVLMKRVEQGVPLETLDLSRCTATSRAVELLSEIVVDVLGPDEERENAAESLFIWDSEARGLFVGDNSSGIEEYHGFSTDPSIDDEGWDDEGWDDGETDDDPLSELHWLLTNG
ncbi:hypothetical protein EI94DRAFT_1762422 [Lactarius quietus]|nr:hypothetical protein EI94DRAFT_1762422 [Lactarius quietus]